MRTGRTLSLIAIIGMLSLTAVAAMGVVTVSQKGRAFNVASIQVHNGQVLHVDNEDRFVHQIYVESPGFTFESDEQEPGTSVEVQFTKIGLYEVRCHIHPKMLLNVSVN